MELSPEIKAAMKIAATKENNQITVNNDKRIEHLKIMLKRQDIAMKIIFNRLETLETLVENIGNAVINMKND